MARLGAVVGFGIKGIEDIEARLGQLEAAAEANKGGRGK
jgi:hypothetical protein